MASTTVYVSPYGNDSNSGGVNSPYKTLQKAVNALQGTGGQIMMRGGVYYPPEPTWIGGGNRPSLTITSYPGEKAVIDGSNLPSYAIPITIRDTSNIRVKGLEIRNVQNHGIEVINGKNIQIENNLVYNTRGMGIRVRGYFAEISGEGDSTKRSSNILIQGNTVFATNLSNQGANKGQGNWGMAIQVVNSLNVKVLKNTVRNNYGEGIGLTLVDGGVVKNNNLTDNFSVQLYLDNASNIQVERNFIRETGNSEFWRDGNPSIGLGLANEQYYLSPGDRIERFHLNNLKIVKNVVVGGNHSIIYGTWAGIHSGNSYNAKGLKNSIVAHNTLYGSRYESLMIKSDPNLSNVRVSNNIFTKTGQGPIAEVPKVQGLQFQANLWSGGSPGNASSSKDVLQAPKFVYAGGALYKDYKLQTQSPGIDKGVILAGINDTGSNPRPDLGAIESYQISKTGSLVVVDSSDRDTPSSNSTSGDVLMGSSRGETLTGTAGNDVIAARSGNDKILGKAGKDVLKGQGGQDSIFAGLGSDTLTGGSGSDRLFGDEGKDRLIGAEPNRPMAGNGEVDELTGGSGADIFVLGSSQRIFYANQANTSPSSQSYAVIKDFQASQSDKILLMGQAKDYSFQKSIGSNIPTGKALYYVGNGSADLIAVIQTQDPLSLSTQSFKFVSDS